MEVRLLHFIMINGRLILTDDSGTGRRFRSCFRSSFCRRLFFSVPG